MSEYQYYEFAAIDGPISDEGLRYARGCSSSAQVSRVRWQNTYEHGDFRGNVDRLLNYYDAHFYIANWGTVRLALAFRKDEIARETIRPYLRRGKRHEETLTVKEAGERCIVYWERDEDGGGGWTEGEGVLDELIGIRDELIGGDYRALFLGWLADFYPEEWQDSKDDSVVMPPIPAGLNQLSPALTRLVEYFPVDPDALAVAVSLSQGSTPARVPMAAILDSLSPPEMRALLARVVDGNGRGVMSELNRLTYARVQAQDGPSIKWADFAAQTLELREARLKKQAADRAAKRQRAAEQREKRLADLFGRAESIWSELDALMGQKILSGYDRAAAQLRQLRDAYAQAGDIDGFEQKLKAFRVRYSNRPAMLRRIEEL
jgi:hypothetical protein